MSKAAWVCATGVNITRVTRADVEFTGKLEGLALYKRVLNKWDMFTCLSAILKLLYLLSSLGPGVKNLKGNFAGAKHVKHSCGDLEAKPLCLQYFLSQQASCALENTL